METTVLIGCPVCGRRYRYDTARFGTSGIRLRCRSCEAVMRVEIPVPLLGESTARAPQTGGQAEVVSREKIPVAVPTTASREALPEASVFQEPAVSATVRPERPDEPAVPPESSVREGSVEAEEAVAVAGSPAPPVLESMSAPPWERENNSSPADSASVRPERPDEPAVPPESSVREGSVEAEEAVTVAGSADPPVVESMSAPPWERETSAELELPAESALPPVPPWEQETSAEPELSATSDPDQPAEPAPPPMDDDAAVHGTRIALEQEAERCLDEIFERGDDAQEAEALPVALVADRDEAMRELLSTALRGSGFQVEEATDGIEARRMLAAHRPAVVFLNAFLPQILGVTLCAEIKGHPELAAGTRVIIVGSLYRRDRFVRDPRNFYGADDFLDGSGSADEIRRRAAHLCGELCGEKPEEAESGVDERGELMRLARIVAGDIILYNPQIAEQEIAEGRFFDTFAQEIREGESLVAHRYPHVAGHQSLYHETLREAVLQHGEAAGIPSQPGS